VPDASDYGIQSVQGGITIKVQVSPRSSSNMAVGSHNGALKVALTAPPVEGVANKALVDFLAKALGVPKSAVEIMSGETSRHKVVRVRGVTVEEAYHMLI
jgi:uncharacterized protein (TIGR00251 family)